MSSKKPKCAVLFDGAGLARFGLEQAGWICDGFELNPIAHFLSSHLGSGRSHKRDVRSVDLSGYDAVWASPPCQQHSVARTQGDAGGAYAEDLLQWSLKIPEMYPNVKILWVENVAGYGLDKNEWGEMFNAAQFEEEPRQNRTRIVGGDYPRPDVHREYKKFYQELPDICPAVLATEWKGSKNDPRRAQRWCINIWNEDGTLNGRGFERNKIRKKLGLTPIASSYQEFLQNVPPDMGKSLKCSPEEFAYIMGLEIYDESDPKAGMSSFPAAWLSVFDDIEAAIEADKSTTGTPNLDAVEKSLGWVRSDLVRTTTKGNDILRGRLTKSRWRNELYRAVGNGVPVHMARSFGEAGMKAWKESMMPQFDI